MPNTKGLPILPNEQSLTFDVSAITMLLTLSSSFKRKNHINMYIMLNNEASREDCGLARENTRGFWRWHYIFGFLRNSPLEVLSTLVHCER